MTRKAYLRHYMRGYMKEYRKKHSNKVKHTDKLSRVRTYIRHLSKPSELNDLNKLIDKTKKRAVKKEVDTHE